MEQRARAVMGALGLTGSKALQKIGTMSGGEKARVALAMFVLVPHNLLILDEPSNHLDVGTVEVNAHGGFIACRLWLWHATPPFHGLSTRCLLRL